MNKKMASRLIQEEEKDDLNIFDPDSSLGLVPNSHSSSL